MFICLHCGTRLKGDVGDRGECPNCNCKYEVVRGWTPQEYLDKFGADEFELQYGAKTVEELYQNPELYSDY